MATPRASRPQRRGAVNTATVILREGRLPPSRFRLGHADLRATYPLAPSDQPDRVPSAKIDLVSIPLHRISTPRCQLKGKVSKLPLRTSVGGLAFIDVVTDRYHR